MLVHPVCLCECHALYTDVHVHLIRSAVQSLNTFPDPLTIKHIRTKPSALSQNLSQLLARMRRCVRVILSTRAVNYLRTRDHAQRLSGREYEGNCYRYTSRARHVKHHAS